uniref:Uncharacterized protein n=1 Tax=Anguilla anguilla TaxID=7936 RepID=A0A0E9Q6P4_ANGAN
MWEKTHNQKKIVFTVLRFGFDTSANGPATLHCSSYTCIHAFNLMFNFT